MTAPRKKRFSPHDIQKMPPGRTMLLLFMVGSALLFLTLIFAHAALTHFHLSMNGYSRLPRAFVLSTLVLTGGTFMMRGLKKYFVPGQLQPLVRKLFAACVCGIVFAALQVWGWFGLYTLNQTEPFLTREWTLMGLISGLHLLHLLAALGLLIYQTVYFHQKTKDPADEVIVAADPFYYGRIRTLGLFWFYTDYIWLVIFLYFLLAL